MGCHTWCHIIVDDYHKKFSKEEINTLLDWYINHLNGWYQTEQNGYVKDEIEKNQKFTKRIKRLFNKGWFKDSRKFTDFLLDIKFLKEDTYKEHKLGYIIEEVKEYGDNLFRVCCYPEDVMLSYEDTLKFLDKYYDENNIYRGGVLNLDKVKEFWDKYPNGLIYVG